MDKLIITVAPTGSVPRKKDTPHVPVTPDEIAETAYRCEQEGAAIIHVHCRDEDERPTSRAVDRLGTRGRAGTLPDRHGSRRRRSRHPEEPAAHGLPAPAVRDVRRRGDVPDATADADDGHRLGRPRPRGPRRQSLPEE